MRKRYGKIFAAAVLAGGLVFAAGQADVVQAASDTYYDTGYYWGGDEDYPAQSSDNGDYAQENSGTEDPSSPANWVDNPAGYDWNHTDTPLPEGRPAGLEQPEGAILLGTEEEVKLTEKETGSFYLDLKALYDDDEVNDYVLMSAEYRTDQPEVLQMDAAGNYQALKSMGRGTITISYTYAYETYDETREANCWFSASGEKTYSFCTMPDLSDAYLSKTEWEGVGSQYAYSSVLKAETRLKGVSGSLSKKDGFTTISAEVVKGSGYVDKISIEDNLITLKLSAYAYSGSNKVRVRIDINGKHFPVTYKVKMLRMPARKYMTAGSVDQFNLKKVKGVKLNVKSSDTSVAVVNSKGKVRAKSCGIAIITVGCNGQKILGCAVNVTTPTKLAVIRTAKYIAKGTYSQARRMENGFYDCSSLVWRAYHSHGINLLADSYAPVASAEASYLVSRGRKVGRYESALKHKNIQPGDLLFKTGEANGQYMGIYHVEMATGLKFAGFSGRKAMVTATWANRDDYYGGYGQDFICRP